MSPTFELLLFSTDEAYIRGAVAAGVDGIIVDWEWIGKEERQRGADTEINRDTLEDLVRVRRATTARVVCRINRLGPWTAGEVESAIEAGADEVLLPMARGPGEVQEVLNLARGRCGVGILVETVEAVALRAELGRLPLSRVFVGLNDLAIERGTDTIFAAVADGTVEEVRRAFDVPFGFAGLTVPEAGWPIPCRLLIGEMARLGAEFSFLRRSFHADMVGRDPRIEVPRIRAALRQARQRSDSETAADQRELRKVLQGLGGAGAERPAHVPAVG